LRDNQRAWLQQPDGVYELIRNRRVPFSLHQHLMEKLG